MAARVPARSKVLRVVSSREQYLTLIEHVTEEIVRHLGERHLTIRSVSRVIGVSPRHLGHVFRLVTGVSFHKYLRLERVTRGAAILLSSQMQVKEVISLVGYTAVSNFSRDFRGFLGMSPKQYRLFWGHKKKGRN